MRSGLETGHSFRDSRLIRAMGGGAPTFLRKGPQQEGSKVVGETER